MKMGWTLGMRRGDLDMWFLFGMLHAEIVGLASLCSTTGIYNLNIPLIIKLYGSSYAHRNR